MKKRRNKKRIIIAAVIVYLAVIGIVAVWESGRQNVVLSELGVVKNKKGSIFTSRFCRPLFSYPGAFCIPEARGRNVDATMNISEI